ncbi:hypothetical protein PWT90_10087 [Aphanocladium album]|nr:hypothetical protein PWT90_10087 [Aphanocladium album]
MVYGRLAGFAVEEKGQRDLGKGVGERLVAAKWRLAARDSPGTSYDLKLGGLKRANRGAQVVEALETRDGQILLGVRLLVEVPAARLDAVAREEDLHVRPVGGLARGRNLQADAVRLAGAKLVGEILAAPAVVDVLVAVVAVDRQRGAVPAGQAEARVRQRGEAQRDVDRGAAPADLDLVSGG